MMTTDDILNPHSRHIEPPFSVGRRGSRAVEPSTHMYLGEDLPRPRDAPRGGRRAAYDKGLWRSDGFVVVGHVVTGPLWGAGHAQSL